MCKVIVVCAVTLLLKRRDLGHLGVSSLSPLKNSHCEECHLVNKKVFFREVKFSCAVTMLSKQDGKTKTHETDEEHKAQKNTRAKRD